MDPIYEEQIDVFIPAIQEDSKKLKEKNKICNGNTHIAIMFLNERDIIIIRF